MELLTREEIEMAPAPEVAAALRERMAAIAR